MKRLFAFLKNRRLILGIGFFLLLLLVWFAGPLVGLKSPLVRILVGVLVLLIAVIAILFNMMRANKSAALIEKSLEEQAATQLARVKPDRKAEIEALREQLNSAIATLKKSKVGRFRWGKSALYELPWYMMIGPPASGKSTAIRHSGLNFPYVNEEGRGIQGIGGTRNCDWWFTNEAVLLDTAGRYTTEEEDKDEWLAFLEMMKKARKRKPINGVLVGVSISDLLNTDEEGIEWHSKNIRKRIDELIQRLGINFPVYIVFTKCDLMRGFVDFFGDMDIEERSQVWGTTLKEEDVKGSRAEAVFEREFDLVYQSLNHRRLQRMGAETKTQSKEAVYFFPLQFRSLKGPLSRFMKNLFEPNPYQENPLFRGFYFTSGTQEGTPIDNVIGAMGKAFGISGDIYTMLGAVQETKSYFIKDLFTKIIFPDQHLAGPSTGAERRRRVALKFSFAASLVVFAALGTVLTLSFLGNKRLVSATARTAKSVHEIKWDDWDKFEENLNTMDKLRGRLVKLDHYQAERPPFMLRWGLYRGDAVSGPARDIFFARLMQLFIQPMGEELESELKRLTSQATIPQEEFPYYYNTLKAYLMMGDTPKADAAFLEGAFQSIMERQASFRESPEIKKIVARQGSYYLEHLPLGNAPALSTRKELIHSSRQVLKGIPILEQAFLKLRDEGDPLFEPYTLEKATQNQRQNVLYGTYKVPGIFTPEGWEGYFKEASVKASEETLKEDWILGDRPQDLAENDQDKETVVKGLRDIYMREYVKEWRAFLQGLHVRSFRNLEDGVDRLHVLVGEDSPLVRVFQAVSKKTVIEKESSVDMGNVKGLFDRARRKLGVSKEVDIPIKKAPPNPLQKSFHTFQEFVEGRKGGSENQVADLKNYVGELGRIMDMLNNLMTTDYPEREARDLAKTIVSKGSGDELHQAVSSLTDMMRDLDVETQRVIEPLLKEPIFHTLSAVLQSALQYMDDLWKDEVYEPYQRSLQQKYPFSAMGSDSTLIDAAEFFHPTDGIFWRFFKEQLEDFLSSSGSDSWRIKTWQGQGVQFSNDFFASLKQIKNISESLFPRGSADPTAAFSLYPYPTPGLSEILLVVDGQNYRYRMGPQIDQDFTWPGPAGAVGAKVVISDEKSGLREEKSFEGRWGLFRLLDAGKVARESSTTFRLEWAFDSAQFKRYDVSFRLKAKSTRNPFAPGLFNNFKCPSRISPSVDETT